MARVSYSATPLLRSLVHRPQGVILVTYILVHQNNANTNLFRRRLSAEGAKPESNNRWKSELGHVCGYVGGYGIWNYLANQGT